VLRQANEELQVRILLSTPQAVPTAKIKEQSTRDALYRHTAVSCGGSSAGDRSHHASVKQAQLDGPFNRCPYPANGMVTLADVPSV